MNTIKIFLENCYGIKKLEHQFDFTNEYKTFSIYSPNGMMKTSFAKTLDDHSRNEESKDLVFPDRKTIRKIRKDEETLKPEEIFVIQPYNESFSSDKVSTLLVNQELRKQYEKIHSDIDEAKNNLLNTLEKLSGLENEVIDKEISKIFRQKEEDKFFEALIEIETRVNTEESIFEEIVYNKIFNEKTLIFLEKEDAQKNIREYVEKYEELIEKSVYFKKGIFNHSQAEDIAKQLEKNGFFSAEHSVLLKGNEQKISTKEDLEKVINEEKKKILKDKELEKKFNVLDKQLTKNIGLKGFREYLSENPLVLPELKNIDSFKAKLWISYLKKEKELYQFLLNKYSEAKEEISKITKQAEQERTEWFEVVEIFNRRFHVPFELTIENQVDVILKNEIPVVAFKFKDPNQTQVIDKGHLLTVLSQGEKRALYILNIIFEIQGRKKNTQETLFVIDDIADSFDYKNKYAIIEYLRDISKEQDFYQIVMTHNFDFHRTICSRLKMSRKYRLNTLKTNTGIKIIEEQYQKNPFADWRNNLSIPEKLIASIPFVRNLAEFSSDKESEEALTSFLHIKEDTLNLKIKDLQGLFSKTLKEVSKIIDPEKKFICLLNETSNSIVKEDGDNMALENKITLAIAIRLKAEQFILAQSINANNITGNQTFVLLEKYKEKYFSEIENIKILEKVLLMTPESIHINSFMYEPIIDMSGDHLKDLYYELKELHPIQ